MKDPKQDLLLRTLKTRFNKPPHQHPRLSWDDVEARLAQQPVALKTLQQMELTGGEPDVIGHDKTAGHIITCCDCSAESPPGRRSRCFDREALDARKENKPAGSVMEAAAAMGVELLDEQQYRGLQPLGEFDTKTSSWVATPPDIRALGGALFCDRRYGKVFVHHNGVQSYCAARGFRGLLRV